MSPILTAVVTFSFAAVVLVVAATVLTRAADTIAELTGIGRVWIGAVLVAAATSLPELTTDVSAVRIGAADLAAGDLFGSGMANMLILAVVDLTHPRRSVLRTASIDLSLTAALAIVLTAVAAMLVVVQPAHELFSFAPGSIMLVVIYVATMRVIYRHGAASTALHESRSDQETAPSRGGRPLGREIVKVVFAAAVIFAAGPALAGAADQLAMSSGLGATFVGTLFVGLVTSLPELVTAIVAVRLGAVDLALGNLFGSNAFNMIIFFAMDAAAPGAVFTQLDRGHVVSALGAILLMSIGLAAIAYRAKRRFALDEPSSALMIVAYFITLVLLYGGQSP